MTTVANNTVSLLRFPEFKDEWQKTSLGKFAPEIKSGLAADQNPERLGVKVTRIETISDRTINLDRIGFVKIDRDIEDFKLLPGDILFSNINSVSHIGKVAFVDRDYDLYQGMNLLRLRTGIRSDPQFLFQKLGSARMVRYFQRICNQAVSQASINQTDLKKTPLLVPTLPEQRKIADFLTAVDGRIGQLSQKKALLEDYKKGVMQQLFTQALRFKDDHGNDFPEWEEKTLGEITKWASGGTPSKDNALFWEGDIPWMSAATMHERYYSDSPLRITVEGVKSGSKMAKKGTLLLLVRGSMLWNRIPVGITTRDVAFNQDVKSLCPTSEVSAEFLLQWFIASENMLLNKVVGTGIGAGKLDTDEMKSLPLQLPHPDEQTKIANFLTALDRKIESVSQQITHTQTFKKGLLQQMFV